MIKALKVEMTVYEYGQLFLIYGKWVFFFYLLFLGWYFILYRKYQPFRQITDEKLPSLTVIVPAYNEGMHVYKTIESLSQCNYPKDRLHIVTVDDGSCDDTFLWMTRARQQFSQNITIIKFKENKGKREALAKGFQISKDEIVVTVDSDSIVNSDTLKDLVSPFIHDPKVGGVAGNVRVLNATKGIIPRMMNVIFAFNFDFIRAGQSAVGSVMCTPGALAAYRLDLVRKNLNEWINQRFLGHRSHIGEDRALTNLIIKSGYHVVFQTGAMVYTNIPCDLPTLWKMLLRWARSDIRETLFMAGFVFLKFRKESMLGTRINFLHHSISMIQNQIFVFLTVFLLVWFPLHLMVSIWIGSMMTSSVSALFYLYRHRSPDAFWAYFYGLFWFFILAWIMPYAMITPQQSGWLTREKK